MLKRQIDSVFFEAHLSCLIPFERIEKQSDVLSVSILYQKMKFENVFLCIYIIFYSTMKFFAAI